MKKRARKKKSFHLGKIQINFTNRLTYTILSVMILVLAGVAVWAVDTSDAWHPASLIDFSSGITGPLTISGDLTVNGLLKGTSYKIFVQPGTGYFNGVVSDQAYYPVNSFSNNQLVRWILNVQVPTGATEVTSIKIYYDGQSSGNLLLLFYSSRWDTDTAGTARLIDLSETGFSTHAGQGSGTGILIVPIAVYDGLSFDEGDIFGLRIERFGGGEDDHYDTNWDVTGVEFIFN